MIEDSAGEVVDAVIDGEVIQAVARKVGAVPHQRAMAAALMRRAADAYAVLTDDECAADLLRELGARARERAARKIKSMGRRR